jgi:hypothetical protein
MPTIRTPNIFEKILLIIGVLIVMIGYGLIYRVFSTTGALTWEGLFAIFLWLILICIIILVAVAENMKEELRIIIENQLTEMRLLREEVKKKR